MPFGPSLGSCLLSGFAVRADSLTPPVHLTGTRRSLHSVACRPLLCGLRCGLRLASAVVTPCGVRRSETARPVSRSGASAPVVPLHRNRCLGGLRPTVAGLPSQAPERSAGLVFGLRRSSPDLPLLGFRFGLGPLSWGWSALVGVGSVSPIARLDFGTALPSGPHQVARPRDRATLPSNFFSTFFKG